jgi:hypothetical protein
MENLFTLVVFVVLAATVYGRHMATRNSDILDGDERPRNLAEAAIVGLVIALCLLISAEIFLHWGARFTPADAPWNMVPAVLWSVGMLFARRHPLDRTSVGTGLATLLPHAYQMLLAETQLLSVTVAALLVGATFFVAVRRESGTQP